MPVYAEDMKIGRMVRFEKRSAGASSGVIDSRGYDTITVIAEAGHPIGTLAIVVRESDTVSGTFSGMTAITGFSAVGITTSNSTYAFIRNRPKRFLGIKLSNASASGVVGAYGLLTGGKRIPGSTTDSDLGFADIVRYPSGS